MNIAVLIAALLGEGPTPKVPPTVKAVVVDEARVPLPHVIVFAADATTVIGVARSDEAGAVELPRPRPRYNFGVLSATQRLSAIAPLAQGRYQLVVAPLPPRPDEDQPLHEVAHLRAPGASVFQGRVVDEAQGGLGGVRVEAVRSSGVVASTAFSRADGRFALVVPGGEYGLSASAPGLSAVRSEQRLELLVVVMGIASDSQTIRVTEGHTLSFRLGDSLDPEYTPPAPVRTWLLYAYGICPTTTPLRAQEKRNLKKYWYLDVLRRDPPNPATISASACMPPSAVPPPSPGQTSTNGFEIWREEIPTRPWSRAP
jgi:hypothetical protein